MVSLSFAIRSTSFSPVNASLRTHLFAYAVRIVSYLSSFQVRFSKRVASQKSCIICCHYSNRWKDENTYPMRLISHALLVRGRSSHSAVEVNRCGTLQPRRGTLSTRNLLCTALVGHPTRLCLSWMSLWPRTWDGKHYLFLNVYVHLQSIRQNMHSN